MRRLVAVAANTFRETVRERVLYNLVFFALLMTASGLLMGQLSIRQHEKILKDVGLAAMDLFGTVIALLIGVGLIVKEIERRSLYPLLVKPLSRAEFFLGKFAGLAFTLFVNLAVMALGLVATVLATGGRVEWSVVQAAYALYLGMLLVVAFAMLFSTFSSSSTLASILTVAVVLVGRFADVIRNMRDVLPGVPPWFAAGLYAVLPNFRHFDFKAAAAYGDPVPAGVLPWLTIYAVAYVGLVLAAGVAAFERRDFR